MKNYKATDHAKLNSKELQQEFIQFMKNEYAGYIDNEIISAHNDGDFDWFVADFFRTKKAKQ